MTRPNIIVLGAGGFVGGEITRALKAHFPHTSGLVRADFEIGKPATYTGHNFEGAILIDCIAQIDGNSNDLTRNNLKSLADFTDYLRLNAMPSMYLYLSTTAADGPPSENAYVRSKQLAEEHVRKVLPASRILRLSFPFGKGEKPNRLISRLIHRIRNGESLKLDHVTLNLTPVSFLTDHIEEVVFSDAPVINFSDGAPSKLHDVVEHLYGLIGKPLDFAVDWERRVDLEVKNPTFFENTHSLNDALEEMVTDVG